MTLTKMLTLLFLLAGCSLIMPKKKYELEAEINVKYKGKDISRFCKVHLNKSELLSRSVVALNGWKVSLQTNYRSNYIRLISCELTNTFPSKDLLYSFKEDEILFKIKDQNNLNLGKIKFSFENAHKPGKPLVGLAVEGVASIIAGTSLISSGRGQYLEGTLLYNKNISKSIEWDVKFKNKTVR